MPLSEARSLSGNGNMTPDGQAHRVRGTQPSLSAGLKMPFLDLHGPLAGDATWRAETLAKDGAHSDPSATPAPQP